MKETSHIIDKEGEVVIILQNPNAPFAVWDEEINPAESVELDAKEEQDVRIRVSAKHLMLASPVFKKQLTGNWTEGVELRNQGSVEIIAENWDVEAFLILLNIFHCHHRSVPRRISLEQLAKVIVLADYYDCPEPIELFRDLWVTSLYSKIPMTYSRDLFLWMWICSYFGFSTEFKVATSIAIRESNGLILGLGLPIKGKFIDEMNKKRQEAISKITQALHKKLETILKGPCMCEPECASIMYGALSRHMYSHRLLSPTPETQFTGLSFEGVKRAVDSFAPPSWIVYRDAARENKKHVCDESTYMSSLIESLNIDVEGIVIWGQGFLQQ